MAINFHVTAEDRGFLSTMDSVRKSVHTTMRDVEQSGKGIEDVFENIKRTASRTFLGLSAAGFINEVKQVRGEFQQLEIAFKTMLGSEQAAMKLMDQLVKTAATTPFDLKGVADGAKMLLAYGIEVDKVNEMLVRLGDVAAGMSIPLGDLVYLYGTTMVQGRMFTQDLRQFQGRGIPIAEELAKVLHVTTNEIGDLVTAGKVTADVFHQAFINMTNDGSKFGGLMEEQSKTILGQISNIEDGIDMMFNDIGKQSEGVINTSLSGVSYLVENWRTVGEAIGVVAVSIGSYKAVMVAVNAVHKANNALMAESAVQSALAAAAGHTLTAAQAKQAATEVLLTNARRSLIVATKELAAATLANPYVWAAAAITTMVVMTYKLVTAENAETIARRNANSEMQEFANKLDDQKNKIQGYIQTLQDANATEYEKAVAWEMLNKTAPTLTAKYDKAALATVELSKVTKELTEHNEELDYENLKKGVEKYTKELNRAKAAEKAYLESKTPDPNGVRARAIGERVAVAQASLDAYEEKLAEINRIRQQMIEDAKPIEIRIQEANDNVHAKEEIYKFYRQAIDLAGELREAHDSAEGTIANTSIPMDYQNIAASVRARFDQLIGELETDVDNLRTKIAESPASVQLDKELKNKEKVLEDLLSMKKEWDWSGATTIPMYVELHYKEAKDSLDMSQGGNRDGMYFNYVSGKWEKTEKKTDTKTAAQWKAEAYGKWKTAEKALNDFYAKKDEMDKAEFDKQVESLRANVDEAKQAYQKYGGSTAKGGKGTNDADKRRAQELQDQWNYEEEMNEIKRNAEDARAQAAVAAIVNDSKREREERKTQHEQTIRDIEQQEDDIYKTIYERRKKLWELNHKDSPYETTDEGSKGYGYTVDDSTGKKTYAMAGTLNTQEKKFYEQRYAIIKAGLDKENAEYNRYILKRYDDEMHAMRDFMKEYGTIQQQKLAITQEYDQKISEEQDEWRKKSLENEKKRKLNDIDIEVLRTEIDWTAMFDGLGSAFSQQINAALEKVESFISSKRFRSLDATQQKSLVDMRNSLYDRAGNKNGLFNFSIYGTIGNDIASLQQALLRQRIAVENHTEAQEQLIIAEKELREAEEQLKKATTPDEILNATRRLNVAKTSYQGAKSRENTTSQAQKDAEAGVIVAQGKLRNSTTDAQKSIENFSKAVGEMTNGTLKGLADGLVNIYNVIAGNGKMDGLAGLGNILDGSAFKGLKQNAEEQASNIEGAIDGAGKIAKAVESTEKVEKAVDSTLDTVGAGLETSGNIYGMIIGAILQILDALGDMPADFFEQLIDKILDAVDGIIRELLNGKLIGQIVTSIVSGVVQIIGTIVDSIGNWFGLDIGLGSLFAGADYSGLEKAKEKYDTLSEVWDELLDKKKEYLGQSWAMEAEQAAEETLRLLRTKAEMNKIVGQAALDSGASMGSHSIRYRMWEGSYTSEGKDNKGFLNSGALAKYADEINWNDVNKAVQRGLAQAGLGNAVFNGMSDMLNMTSEQLEWIKENYTGLWAAMDDDFRQALENIIEFGEQEKEIMEQLKEQITGTTFDSVFNSFMDSLYSLADGSEEVFDDVANNWQKMMNQMVLNNLVGSKYKEKLRQWYDQWEQVYSGDKRIYADEIESLKASYNKLIQDAAAEVEALRENGIVSALESEESKKKDQSATYSFADKVTYDQMEEFTGILTAIQIAVEHGGDVREQILVTLQTMAGMTSPDNQDVREIRNLLMTTNDYLLDIKKSNREILNSMVEQFEIAINAIKEI